MTETRARGRRAAVVLAALVLAAAAVLVGWTAMRSGQPGTGGPEAGFARDMSAHHAQAVRMSFIIRDRTQDPAVRLLAYDIINTQSAQIGMMTAWLDEWDLPKTDPAGPMRWMSGHAGHRTNMGSSAGSSVPAGAGSAPAAETLMPGMASRERIAELEKASGRAAEVLFLRLMIAHHRGGVAMAEAVLAGSGHDRVRRLAQTMVDGQRSEITLMNGMLKERGSAAA